MNNSTQLVKDYSSRFNASANWLGNGRGGAGWEAVEMGEEKQIMGHGMALSLRSVAVISDGLAEAGAHLWQSVRALGQEGLQESALAQEIMALANSADDLRSRLKPTVFLEDKSAGGGDISRHVTADSGD